MATNQYSWENNNIDDNYLQQFATAKNPAQFLTGNQSLGAQAQSAAITQMGLIQKAIDQKWQQTTQQLTAINPAFDPTHYLLDASKVYDFGEGASSNRNAVISRPQLQLQSQQRAIQMAQQAAQKYQQTGQIDPYPDMKTLAAQAFPYDAGNDKALTNIVSRATGNVSPEDKEKANAAAARVGSPLPYSDAKIGSIVPGGVFTNQDIQNAQTKGINYDQIAQQAQNGTFQSQANQGFAAGGVNGSNPVGGTTTANSNQNGGPQRSTYAAGPAGDQQYQNALARYNSTGTAGTAGTTQTPLQGGSSQGAQDLVKQVLNSGQITNLQSLPFWSNSPNKQEAYKVLQNIFSSPQNLASYVQQNGITNLEQQPWWSSYPQKQDAWSMIQQAQQTGQPIQGSTLTGQTNTQGTTGNQALPQAGAPGPGQQQGAQTPGTTQPNGQPLLAGDQANQQQALDIINNANIDEHTKDIYRQAVSNWDPTQEVNVPNILKTFSDIKSSTIDPFYRELTSGIIDQVKRGNDFNQQQRGIELESEQRNASEAIRGTKNDLEGRGMTFAGEGIRQLGAQSAYAQPGTSGANQTAMPTQTPFGGQYIEGLVPQSNRLIASSSAARFQKQQTDLSRQAEQQLGSVASQGLVPGVPLLGGIDKSAQLPYQQQGAEASTLNSLYGQEQQNVQARQPLNVFNQ